MDSLSDIRKGYRQGKVGAHTDSGNEFAHGRAEKGKGSDGTQLSKQPKARQDGGMENARGKMNQRSEMGKGKGYDPTICRYGAAHTDRGMEHARGRDPHSKAKKGY